MGQPAAAIDSVEIHLQLDRILHSQIFARAQRSQNFLRYIIDRSLKDPEASIKEYTVALDVFERDASYDPSVDATVRVEASRLRSRLHEYYATEGGADPLLIDVPKGAYTPVFSHRDPPAFYRRSSDQATASFSPSTPPPTVTPLPHTSPPAQRTQADPTAQTVHHVPTPALAVPTTPPPASRTPLTFPSVRALAILIALGALGLSLFAWKSRSINPSAQSQIHSLAVLPLDNLSGDPAQEYLAAGFTDELITMLAKNSTLHITSRTSVMQYKGVHRPLREIARELGVDGVLEGSVVRSGDKVHLNIQLIQAPGDTHLWAESYDRDLNDLMALPRVAARTIARQLNSAVPEPRATRYVSPEAHDAYLHGRYLWFLGNNDKAGEYFRQATTLQPDYALGWSGLADFYNAGINEGQLDPRDSLGPGKAAALRAIDLDDSLAEAHLSLSAALLIHDWDFAGAESEVNRATELYPNFAEAYHFHAKILAALGRHADAITAQRRATELDPFARPWAMALSLLLARQYDAALNDARQRLESTPADVSLHEMLSAIYRCQGKDAKAVAMLEQQLLLEDDKSSAAGIHRAFEEGGYRSVLTWQINHLEQRSVSHYVSPVDLANLNAQLGRREQTLSLLEDAYRQHAPGLLWIEADPAFDFLHQDPRYQAVIAGLKLPPPPPS